MLPRIVYVHGADPKRAQIYSLSQNMKPLMDAVAKYLSDINIYPEC